MDQELAAARKNSIENAQRVKAAITPPQAKKSKPTTTTMTMTMTTPTTLTTPSTDNEVI